jgi:alpha-tubulin suppressor-like RCC1 family protein
MNVKLNKKKIIEKINKDNFSDEQQSLLLTENKDANEILFPFTLESEYNEEENSTNINDKNLNNYFDNKNTKKNKDNSMLRTLKSNDYYGITISDNKTPNMTTLDRTRNIPKNKLTKYINNNNNNILDKSQKNNINAIGNKGYYKKNIPKKIIIENDNYLNAYAKKSRQNNINFNQYLNEMQNKKNILKNELLPKYYNYKQATITVFAKILDIDIINDSNEVEDKSWSEEYIKIYKKCLKNNSPIQKIFISNTHSMILNSEGKVFTWGWNNYGQCGTFPEYTKQNFILPEFQKGQNKKYPQLPILNYKSSDDILPIQNIDDILLNDNFSIILTEKGNAISFGKNSNGELGLSHKKEIKSAQLISKFKNKVKIIKSTGNTNLLLTKNNELYIWSLSKKILLQKPTMIYLPKRIQIESISTGKNFAILLTNNGICYGCGSNELGELGMKNIKYCLTPEEIIELMKYKERIIQVRCGYKHTICLSETGKCFTWGNNTYGQLGHKNNGINLPLPIFIEENNDKIKIIQVAAGFRASFFLSYNRNIFYCGMLNNKTISKIPLKFNLYEKNNDILNENEFSIVRILCSYSLYKSVFYASIADVRNLYSKFKNQQRINEILDILAENWLNDKKYPPFIPEIAKFFNANFMRIND